MTGIVGQIGTEASHAVEIITTLPEFSCYAEKIITFGEILHQFLVLEAVSTPAMRTVEESSIGVDLAWFHNVCCDSFRIVDCV